MGNGPIEIHVVTSVGVILYHVSSGFTLVLDLFFIPKSLSILPSAAEY